MKAQAAAPCNALTIDVEDWYQGIGIDECDWGGYEQRLGIGMGAILDALRQAEVKATFFILGCCAAEHPELVAQMVAEGHEIGTHGWSHSKVYDLSLGQFEDELARSVETLEAISGAKVRGHRAPFFSITMESYAALGLLKKYGIEYDASIYPGANYRYGIDGSPSTPYYLEEFGVQEFPVSVIPVLGRKLGLGGAYFRILPYSLTRQGMQQLNQSGQVGAFYAHPWEFDPRHPRVNFQRKAQLTHYFNLPGTLPRFTRLLRDFNFAPMGEVLARMNLPSVATLATGDIGQRSPVSSS